MPIPIVKRNGTWFFDTKAGREEILYRRIGSNELDAIQICRNYVEAQLEYAQTKHDGSERISTHSESSALLESKTVWCGGMQMGVWGDPSPRASPMLWRRDTRIRRSHITDISSRS